MISPELLIQKFLGEKRGGKEEEKTKRSETQIINELFVSSPIKIKALLTCFIDYAWHIASIFQYNWSYLLVSQNQIASFHR